MSWDWLPVIPVEPLAKVIELYIPGDYPRYVFYGASFYLGMLIRNRPINELRRRVAKLEQQSVTSPPMFPLKARRISGFKFGQVTWYTLKHRGVDYAAKYEPLYAPFDGEIIAQYSGTEGGKMIYFRPDHDDVIIRFLHLKEYTAPRGRVRKGQQIAVTGNTGILTTGPHLHLDINRNPRALLAGNLDFSNFIDPEKYDWGGPVIQVPVTGIDQPIVNNPIPATQISAPVHVTGEAWYRITYQTKGNVNVRSTPVIEPNERNVVAKYKTGDDMCTWGVVEQNGVTWLVLAGDGPRFMQAHLTSYPNRVK